ncbi:galactokinase [Bacteroidota bacterium]
MRSISESSLPLLRSLVDKFNVHFGEIKTAAVVLSPASIILLGDHTHYNDGISISASVDKYTAIAVRERKDEAVYVVAGNQSFPINAFSDEFFEKVGSFELRFIRKLVQVLRAAGKLTCGFDCAITTNIPLCIGLGYYTPLLIGALSALNIVFKLNLSFEEMVEFSRKVELSLIGKISNKSLHYTVAKGKKNRLFYFDLRNENYTTHSLPEDKYKLVICDTNEIIERVEDLCNERITECEVGAKGLRLYIWGITNLRDVELEFLEKHIHMIPKRVYQRCLYNVKERIRVEKAVKAWKKKDYELVGRQMFESHESLSADYELSSTELDFLVNESKKIEGVIGAKMVSCTPHRSTLNFVETEKVDDFIKKLNSVYKHKYNKKFTPFIFDINECVKHIPYKDLTLSL